MFSELLLLIYSGERESVILFVLKSKFSKNRGEVVHWREEVKRPVFLIMDMEYAVSCLIEIDQNIY